VAVSKVFVVVKPYNTYSTIVYRLVIITIVSLHTQPAV